MPFCDSRRSNNLCSLANSKTKSTTLNNFSLLFQSHMANSFCLSRGPTGTNRTLHTSNKDMINDYRCSIVFRKAISSVHISQTRIRASFIAPTAFPIVRLGARLGSVRLGIGVAGGWRTDAGFQHFVLSNINFLILSEKLNRDHRRWEALIRGKGNSTTSIEALQHTNNITRQQRTELWAFNWRFVSSKFIDLIFRFLV